MNAPGPDGLAGLAAAVQILKNPAEFIMESAGRYGLTWATRFPDVGWRRLGWLFWMMGPEANERLLAPQYKEDFSWFAARRMPMEPIFGRDILLLLDDEPGCPFHRNRHRRLAPSFNASLDDEYVPLIAEITERHLREWPVGTSFDLQWEVKRIAFHVVARLFFGADDAELPELVHEFEELGLGLFSIVHLPIPGSHFQRGRRARKKLASFLAHKIETLQHRSDLSRSVLGQLLRPAADGSPPLSVETLIGEMMSFIFAGYDTTASFITSLFAALGDHPAVGRRVLDELRALPEVSPVSLETLEETDRAMLEVERLWPSLVFNLHGVKRSFEFRGIEIPAGEFVCYSPYHTGRMAELWEAPLEFRPDRFRTLKPAPYTMVGFGAGHRPCIGKRFARMEAGVVAATVYRRFNVEILPHSEERTFNPAMHRKHGLPARVRRI